jgi:F-type H+-transporting ATPase subunit epsilon
MKVFIYTIEKTLYEGDAEVISLPSTEGEIAVLHNHAPTVTALHKGKIAVKNGKERMEFDIQSGFAEINQGQTILLVR